MFFVESYFATIFLIVFVVLKGVIASPKKDIPSSSSDLSSTGNVFDQSK